jgi:hypothetical protein
MADQPGQNFANHTKLVAPFHFLLVPVLVINLLYRLWQLWVHIDSGRGRLEATMNVLLAFAFMGTALAARVFALQAQDRTIRLEEMTRFKCLLSPEQFARVGELKRSQLIALRFCPDAELPGLYTKVLSGELSESKAIKGAIKNWRGDYFRL